MQTAWLKLHYPVQFMAALMNSVAGNSDKVGYYIQTCRKRGIRVLPPDVNRSQEKFSVEEGAIRFGFAGVKNLGHGAIQAIVSERAAGGAFRDVFDFCERVACAAVNKKCVESLIRAGAMDALPGNRAQKLACSSAPSTPPAVAKRPPCRGSFRCLTRWRMWTSPRRRCPIFPSFPGRTNCAWSAR